MRKSHAVLDLDSRRRKALKIERLIGLCDRRQPFKLLDIGTGSGAIAHYFATRRNLHCDGVAVDIVDQRLIKDGFQFLLVENTDLPFSDAFFDVVISNHVIEHVGSMKEQKNHLREMRRVMTTNGVGYLATPNRWMVMEPHYRLPFLSWLPDSLRHFYVRLTKKGENYDCNPLTPSLLERCMKGAGFYYQNLAEAGIREMLRTEVVHAFNARMFRAIPPSVFRKFYFLVPTLVYRLLPRKQE
ncbi:class I SAM-dependent methyltransferase [Desulfosoma sp.]|uniref:class I SAM-dependent methyltransferase n=1 Tax=Desulfosoma sp. TaxID=2603217 RepID=UPI00404AD367